MEQKYFFSGIFQNYLVFLPAKKHIRQLSCASQVDSWKSNGISEEDNESITKSTNNFHQLLLIIISYQT